MDRDGHLQPGGHAVDVSSTATKSAPGVLWEAAIVIVAALLPAVVSGLIQIKVQASPFAQAAGADEVTVEEAASWEGVLWVDGRSRAKFEKDHVPGAVLLNEEEWETQIPAFLDAWDPDRTVVVYCDSAACGSSAAIARRLKEDMGLKKVRVLKGGWQAWQQAAPDRANSAEAER